MNFKNIITIAVFILCVIFALNSPILAIALFLTYLWLNGKLG